MYQRENLVPLKLTYSLHILPANGKRAQWQRKALKHCWPVGNQKQLINYTRSILLTQPSFALTAKVNIINPTWFRSNRRKF